MASLDGASVFMLMLLIGIVICYFIFTRLENPKKTRHGHTH